MSHAPPASSATGVRLYVGNLPYRTTEEELFEFMGGREKVKNVKIVIDRDTKQSKGFGFVEFLTKDFADEALARNGEKFGGRGLRIDVANPQSRPASVHPVPSGAPRDARSGGNGAGASPASPASPPKPDRPVIGRGQEPGNVSRPEGEGRGRDDWGQEDEHGRGRR